MLGILPHARPARPCAGPRSDHRKGADALFSNLGTLVLLVLFVLLVMQAVRFVRSRIGSKTAAQREQARRLRKARREEYIGQRDAYLDSLPFASFYQLLILFVVASFGGLVIETVWVFVSEGIWQSRYGMVWGPLSPLYGVGAIVLTAGLWNTRGKPLWVPFVISVFLGSGVEQVCGMIMEQLSLVSWSYSAYPDAVTRYVSLRMSLAWGILGVLWCKIAMPEIIYRIGEPSRPVKTTLSLVLVTFLLADAIFTVCVVVRKDARDEGVPAESAFEVFIDDHYGDSFIEQRFENLDFDYDFNDFPSR